MQIYATTEEHARMLVLDRNAVREATANKDFGRARRYLQAVVDDPGLSPEDLVWAVQKLALCTYKDPELQTESALDEAFQLLERRAALNSTDDPETLSLAGAIQKRVWEVNGDLRALSRSLSYYGQAQTCATTKGCLDQWTYAAVNVAFVLDLIARDEASVGAHEMTRRAQDLQAEAKRVRQAVCAERERMLIDDPDTGWWLAATLIEACFGLGEIDTVRQQISDALAKFRPDGWMQESMARQLAALASIQHSDATDVDRALAAIEPLVSGEAARALVVGKIGLSLSGGGFRAALFHVGVLARLAEFDLLRHVDVISCVSGGSILGAQYFLELKRELSSVSDENMARANYISVVQRVQDRLVAALQKDIRTAAILSSANTLLSQRTVNTGTMIGAALYADGACSNPRLSDLVFTPAGHTGPFNPKRDNWRRQAKVPILILNATTLNTGHNWQFTATWMGEAPTCIEPAVDASERLRRMYHSEAPQPHDQTLLSTAVAASAAVPGIFRPIVLEGLYPGRLVRLSDGGVHDNQGIFGLLEQDCNVMIVSDGCGQLPAAATPPWAALGVLQRANSVLMDAVRRGSYRILANRLRTRRLKELRFLHLKKGLPTRDLTWVGGAQAASDAILADQVSSGLDERVQRALASIRTDLDNFSENECYGLMLAGYRIADRDYAAHAFALARTDAPREHWRFRKVEPLMEVRQPFVADPARAAFADELECGRHLFFRRARLSEAGSWIRQRLARRSAVPMA